MSQIFVVIYFIGFLHSVPQLQNSQQVMFNFQQGQIVGLAHFNPFTTIHDGNFRRHSSMYVTIHDGNFRRIYYSYTRIRGSWYALRPESEEGCRV